MSVESDDLSFGYYDSPLLFRGCSFAVETGKTIGIMGPSGSGKSTLLRLIAGLLSPSSGTIRVAGVSPTRAASEGRISFAFQEPALLPWRSVLSNVLLPLELVGRAPQRDRYLELFRALGIGELASRYPSQLSGGQAQRAGLARALLMEAPILLLDEPLSSVDWPLRIALLAFLRQSAQSLSRTTLVVSHDSRELVFLCDRVIVLDASDPAGFRTFEVPAVHTTQLKVVTTTTFFQATIELDNFAYPQA